MLAAAGPRGISRERVRAIFWPDAEDEAGRQALRQTLYALQRDLGVRAILAEPALRLDPDVITSDIDAFRTAIADRDWRAALAIYHGPFAAGFSVPDAPDFEVWLDGQRAELHRQALAAAEALAREAEAAGDRREVANAWRRLTELEPFSARYAASYMSALAGLGDRSGALAHARQHANAVRRELEAEPDQVVVQLEATLRTAGTQEVEVAPSSVPASPAPLEPTAARPAADSIAAPPEGRPRRWTSIRLPRLLALGAIMAAIGVVGATLRAGRGWARRPILVLAVGQFRDLTADSSRSGLSEVLTTSLARLSDVEVIANSRILELLGTDGATQMPGARDSAARRAGATEVVEGELIAASGGQFRLALRRVTLGRGALQGGYTVTGTDWLSLIDSATSLIAADLRLPPPERSLREFSPRSRTAARLFEEGLHALFASRNDVALRLFDAALAEDSTYALAAYYAHRAKYTLTWRDAAYEARALALSVRASDRDRLLVQTAIRIDQQDTLATVYADSLASRFPRDPEGLALAARAFASARLIDGRTRELYERSIAIDSAAGLDRGGPCRLCGTLAELVAVLRVADSTAAAERVARRWRALRPADSDPVGALALLQFSLGRYDSAAGTLATFPASGNDEGSSLVFIGRLLDGRLDEADDYCMLRLTEEDPRGAEVLRWLCAIVWRNQGRLFDAAGLVFSARLPNGRALAGPMPRDRIGEYVLHLEMRRPAAANRVLEEVVPRREDGLPPGLFARELTWNLARRATALVATGNQAAGRLLADSAEATGRQSLYGRDHLLHYFIRGLVARAAGDHSTAVDYFRRSIHSPTFGYTRANFELAGSLLALHRPEEAAPPLQAALRGGWDGSNLYVTRTEIHERLAEAFVAMGQRDSAATHYAVVERSWRRADPQFAARYRTARDFLARQRNPPAP
ncbi:MAG: BTAD domain-containing putative transcriptional regulator [Gemmatimonadales bacterium]|nr:BTAD domain-containing putative transcriptional regulator [Gemmatimonadales bacterium]